MSDLPKPKAYLLMIDESVLPFLNSLVPGLQFIEVIAVNVKDTTEYVLLGNPVPKAQPKVSDQSPEAESPVISEANGN